MTGSVRLIGASSRYTNSTCVYGSMAGLAPTSTVRPHITNAPGYKYSKVANDANNYEFGCGLGKKGTRACEDGKRCIEHVNYPYVTKTYYLRGSKLLG